MHMSDYLVYSQAIAFNSNEHLPTRWSTSIICVRNYKEETKTRGFNKKLFPDKIRNKQRFCHVSLKVALRFTVRVLDLSEACQPINSYDPIYGVR